jgi:hypothetical protein
MFTHKIKKNKFELLLITIAFLISFAWADFNLKNFDNNKINFNGKWFNQIAYHDLDANWRAGDEFRNRLKNGENFFEALPLYEKWFLPAVIVGAYYFIIDEEIYELKNNGQKVIKTENSKFYLILFQIIFFYFSLIIFSKQLKKKVNNFLYKTILIFLCLEPSILQWHSTLWTESIYLSLMLISFSIIIRKTSNPTLNFFLGLLFGLLFLQRSVSILYIIPLIIYYVFIFRLKFKPYFFLVLGYMVIIILLGLNNYKKSENFHVLSKSHQNYSFYHYFAHIIYADTNNISPESAKIIVDNDEKDWILKNNLDLTNFQDYKKTIEYKNKIFLEIVLENPWFTLKYYSKKIITMCIIHPLWTHYHFFVDKSDPEAKKNPKKYYHKNLTENIVYSLFIYFFVMIGFFSYLKNIVYKKKISDFDSFLIFNIFSIAYFILISGFWGNPKYFAPCMISVIFFFSIGLEKITKNVFKKKIN